MKKKPIILLLTAALLLSVLSGCGSPSEPQSSQAPASSAASSQPEEISSAPAASTRTFTDSLGREVEVPAELRQLAPSGSLAQLVLYGLAPDRMVGWCTKPTEDMARYFKEEYIQLPTFGTFYGKNADLNLEAVLAAAPEIVIDLGEIKGDMTETLDGLQEQLSIPVVFIEARLDSMGDAYRSLGELLGLPEEAKALADYCDSTIADAKEKSAAIPEEQRVRVYYGLGGNGLQTNPKGSFHAEVLDLVGAVNVAEDGVAPNGGEVSMEQLLLWQPDVILFDPDSAYSSVGTDPLWKDLTAVQQQNFFEIPSGPYNWMGRPPAVNRILGVKWLGNLLYPAQFDYDMIEEAKTFYKLFYHYELTDEQAKDLMGNSQYRDSSPQ